ncbi:SH3 domain and tetratricopeptide repeat-containing protein 1 [Ambystoma mexicanum]|uniref:SH3 domain and tetratricopeptide repeat-containing protein 1 n=1 Tax=Ambystoma mexicanum TaxID=8296 RepID=UPI0037E797D2
MELPSAGTIEFPLMDIKRGEEENEWKSSVHPTAGLQPILPLWDERKKHKVSWEEKTEQIEESYTTDVQPDSPYSSVSAETATQEEESPFESKDPIEITDTITDSSETCVEPAESFPTDISLQLVMVKRKSGLPDPRLQGVLRRRLRLLENDSKEVMAVFGELSARLLSIHSDQDLIIVTFKTFEEIWKFSTYYSLGFFNHCMENLLLDQSFWLLSEDDNEEEEAGIEVCISDGYLNLMYKGLLMQEGSFFVHCPGSRIREAVVVESKLKLQQNEHWDKGEARPSELDSSISHSKASLEPVSPFHQWFLKTCSIVHNVDSSSGTPSEVSNQIAVGSCVAVVDYVSEAPEEMSFECGDKIEIVGFYIKSLQWFVGKHSGTGKTGLVETGNVKPDIPASGLVDKDFLEEEKLFFKKGSDYDCENAVRLLKKLTKTDVHTVYRLDAVEEKDTKNTKEKDMRKSLSSCKVSISQGMVKETLRKCSHGKSAPKRTENQEVDQSLKAAEPSCEGTEQPTFCINREGSCNDQDILESLLQFLNSKEYQPCYKNLYDMACPFLNTIFQGYNDENELVRYLSLAREAAKKASMHFALTRVCFLLGRLSAKKNKFSQARVYFEEALAVIRGEFGDLILVVAVYTNLIAIYLKQKYKEKYLPIFDKVSSLLLSIPNCVCSTGMESIILKHALKRAVLHQDKQTEARACFLLVKLYSQLKQYEEVLPFLERLQALDNSSLLHNQTLSANRYIRLSEVYTRKCLPHIALSCVKAAIKRSSIFKDFMRSVELILINAPKLYGLKKSTQIFPTQIAPYLRQALSSVSTQEEKKLSSMLYTSLSELYASHKEYRKAIEYMTKAFDTNISVNTKMVRNLLVSLAWLHVLQEQNNNALDILNEILESEEGTCQELGVIYNINAIALRRTNRIKEATLHYYKALYISKECAMISNQAIVLANFGILCLHAQAYSLAGNYLLKSATLFCELQCKGFNSDFIQVLLLLGHYYINGSCKDKGRLYYEWAFLVAMEANNYERQLQALQLLCQFYRTFSADEAQCIIYNKYQLSLVRKMSDKVFESQILESISHLYLSLGVERAYRSALEYTKRSLGIFIDLQQKDKEAYAWLQAGKIYHVLGQNELVDLYIQVALEAALCTGDPNLAMELFECAGDIYANGTREREKALPFYRDRALPLAVKIGNERAELKLCNKLVELLINLKAYEEALDYAKVSLALSVTMGFQLNERVAYHRLACIYHQLGQCELAEHYYLKALSLCPSVLEFDEEAVYYMKVYLILGDITFNDLKDPFDAAGYYHLALAAAMDLGNKKAQLKIYTKLAIIYHNFLVDRELSLFFYKKARVFASELNVRRINLSAEQCYQATAWAPFNNLI